jgi:hypothetical protein
MFIQYFPSSRELALMRQDTNTDRPVALALLPCDTPSPSAMGTLRKRLRTLNEIVPPDAPMHHLRNYAEGFMRSASRIVGAA